MVNAIICKIGVPLIILIFWIALLTLAQILWKDSLLTCDKDFIACLKWLKSKMFLLINKVFYYCLIHFVIFLTALLVREKWLKYVGIFLAIASFAYRWNTSHGFSALDHSKANVQICGIIFTVMLSITLWMYSAYKSFKVGKGCLGIYLVVWITIWSMIYHYRIGKSCEHLQDSIHPDVRYSEEGGECKWVKGDICWDFTIEGGFKPLFWGKDRCELIEDNLAMHRK